MKLEMRLKLEPDMTIAEDSIERSLLLRGRKNRLKNMLTEMFENYLDVLNSLPEQEVESYVGKVVLTLREIGKIAKHSRNYAMIRNTIQLMGREPLESIATAILRGCYFGNPTGCKMIDYFRNYHKDPSSYRNAAEEVTWTLSKTNSRGVVDRLCQLIVGSSPKKAALHAEMVRKLVYGHCVDIYERVCSSLKEFDCFVYREFADYLVQRKDSDMGLFVEKERNFLNQHTSEVVFPLAWMMVELGDKYFGGIKLWDEQTKVDLARAYSIAGDNVDGSGEDYLEVFYENLKGTLDTRPQELGKWAASICDDFKKQGDAGLLRGVEG